MHLTPWRCFPPHNAGIDDGRNLNARKRVNASIRLSLTPARSDDSIRIWGRQTGSGRGCRAT
jgi:hypothetical protein